MEEIKKDRRLRLIWSSNAPWSASGYSTFTKDFSSRLKKDEWNIGLIGWAGHEGMPIDYGGIPVYGKMGEAFGGDALYFHSKHFNANVSFTMQDLWSLNNQFLQQLNNEGGKFIPYVPIDQDPIPINVIEKLRYAYKIITFSQFGHKTLMKHGFTSTFIPEGTDTEIFKPLDKQECRKLFNIPPDAFVVGMVGANKENPPRKGWQEALEAFKLFHDKHPEAIFFFHSNQFGQGGFPIPYFAQTLGLQNSIRSVDAYISTFHFGSPEMNKLLNSFDFLTHASLSEGFGLIIIEAQAAGIPVIVNNAQSQPELVIEGKTGLICKTAQKYFTNAGGYYIHPDVNSLYDCMEQLFLANRIEMGRAARKHIVENYNIDTIFNEKWLNFLTNLQDEILGKSVDSIPQKV